MPVEAIRICASLLPPMDPMLPIPIVPLHRGAGEAKGHHHLLCVRPWTGGLSCLDRGSDGRLSRWVPLCNLIRYFTWTRIYSPPCSSSNCDMVFRHVGSSTLRAA